MCTVCVSVRELFGLDRTGFECFDELWIGSDLVKKLRIGKFGDNGDVVRLNITPIILISILQVEYLRRNRAIYCTLKQRIRNGTNAFSLAVAYGLTELTKGSFLLNQCLLNDT